MALGTSNRDGGKTSESGHLRALGKFIAGHILEGLQVSQRGAGANMSVDVAIGDAMIPRSDGTYSHPVFNDAVYNRTVSAADGSNPRRDIVVMYVDYGQTPSTAVSNNTNGVVKIVVVPGTAAGSPVDPNSATIQAAVGSGNPWIPLARLRIAAAASSVTNSMIDDLRVLAQSKLQTAVYSEIINAACEVGQRVTAPNLSTTYQYGVVDRFACKGTGTAVSAGTIAQTAAANVGSTGYALKLAGVTITGTGKVFARYRMEARDALRFKNGIASAALKVYHDVGSAINYIIRIQKPTAADNFTSLTSIADSGNISVPSGTATLIKFENINSGNLGDVSNGLEIEIEVACGAITTKNFEFTDWQLNLGSVVNPNFIGRQFADEIAACQRYYEKSYPYASPPGTTYADVYYNSAGQRDNGGGNAFIEGRGYFKVRKRAAPTMRWYNPRTGAGTTHWAAGGVTGTDYTAMTVNLGFETMCYFASTTSGGDFHIGSCWTAESEL